MNFPGFDQIEKIGESSRTTLWKARQASLDRFVCIRVLKPKYTADHNEVSAFVEPSRAASRIKHANMIQIYDVAEYEGKYYLVMEYIGGMTVAQMLQNGPFPQRKAFEIAKQIASALDQAWQLSRIIHRNLKPSVISIDGMGVAKISDISLATVIDPQANMTNKEQGVEGTPNYMAPEQARGTGPFDFRTDMYGLGATLYHMLTGRTPFAGLDSMDILEHHISGYLKNPREIEPSINVSAVKVISRLMMKNPLDRYDTWTEAIHEMDRVASGGLLISRNATPSTRPSTIAPEGGFPEVEEASNAKGTSPSTASTRRVSRWVSIPAWILLVLFWIWWAFFLMDIPVHTVITRHFTAPPAQESEDDLPEPPVAPHALPSPGGNRATPPQSPIDKAQLSDEERSILAPGKEEIVRNLLDGRWAKALERAEWETRQTLSEPAKAHAREILSMVTAVSQTDRAVADGFMSKVGKVAEINNGEKTIRVKLQAMSGDTVRGVMADSTETPVLFTLASLDPLERSRWIGPADTPEKCAMKYLLYMQAGEFTSAAAFAEKCGPLSDAFKAAALAKTAPATKP